MVAPFLAQIPFFAGPSLTTQAIGVFAVLVTLLVADFVAGRVTPAADGRQVVFTKQSQGISYLMILTAFVIPHVSHLLSMPQIPLLEKWKHMGDRAPDVHVLNTVTKRLFDGQEKFLAELRLVRDGRARGDAASQLEPAISEHAARTTDLLKQADAAIEKPDTEVLKLSEERQELLAEYLHMFVSLRRNELEGVEKARSWVRASSDKIAERTLAMFEAIQRNDKSYFEKISYAMSVKQSAELARMRESSSKLLSVSPLLIYYCQSTLYLVPAVLVGLFYSRMYLLGGLLLAFSLFYSKATLAKAPILIMGALLGLLLWQHLAPGLRKVLLIVGAFVLTLALSVATYFYATNPMSIFRFRVPESVQQESLALLPPAKTGSPIVTGFSVGDHSRLVVKYRHTLREYDNARSLTEFEKMLNFIAYRVFLTPVEVSNRWYSYFPDVEGGYLGFEGLTPGSRNRAEFVHPATRVGRWAYVTRFPENYGDSIRAYASVDADAYARWGLLGIFLMCAAIFTVRVGLAVVRTQALPSRSLYLTGVLILAIGLPQASLAALFVSQGLGVVCLLLLAMRVRRTVFKQPIGALNSWEPSASRT